MLDVEISPSTEIPNGIKHNRVDDETIRAIPSFVFKVQSRWEAGVELAEN